ncbi:hypothetical protein HDV57DRAFT_485481 [Trichoderma longibrachiatum]|uniref:Uncharacterized protein n=1 Tax=Trichoderma longibrachiatum ATCC 18648 TaxID=983965 RepID=A0A2T4CCM4_TRILO|nr:hypothetical protein M440DRAFT_233143 [Trichoderma longibrachiatum ATCC 18648]
MKERVCSVWGVDVRPRAVVAFLLRPLLFPPPLSSQSIIEKNQGCLLARSTSAALVRGVGCPYRCVILNSFRRCDKDIIATVDAGLGHQLSASHQRSS